MAQPGNFTPILLYGSSTPTNVPLAANLTNSATGSEIAINVADKNLFFKDSGGTVNTVPIRQSSTSSNGWLSATDWNTFNNKSNTNGTVTSVAALTIGTTGTDLSSTVANGTTTPVITLNVPTASATNRGALNAADWATFNGKQAALVSGTNIKTVGGVTLLGSGDVGTIGVGYGGTGLTAVTAGYVPFGSSASALSTSANLFWNTGTNTLQVSYLAVGTTFQTGYYAAINGDIWQGNTGGVVIGTITNNAGWYSLNGSANVNGAQLAAVGAVRFLPNNTEAARFDTSGNLLLGTTSLGGAGISFTTPDNSGVLSKFSAAGTGFQYRFGNVTNGYVGSITTTTVATAYNVTSDKRLKTLINVATDTSVIDNTVVNDFTWLNGIVDRGVFAQDAYKVKPSAVHVGSDELDEQGNLENPWSVDYSKYVPDLIVKCQQQDKIINELLTRLIALETK